VRVTIRREDAAWSLTRNGKRARTALRLQLACEAVEERFALPVSLEQAARFAGMERTYFSRAFKKHRGIGFAAWLRELRIGYAKDLLRGSAMRITDIALASGFSDISTFERGFQKSVGLSPRRYRSLVREDDGTSALMDFHAGF
jgi:transcriptional regulator GlxA family with amidase domain